MYKLIPAMLLMLPSFSFARPAQPNSPLNLVAPSPDAPNPIGPEPIDPRFDMEPLYQATPLDEEHCLVTAVEFLGRLGAGSFLEPLRPTMNYWDDRFPNVEISHKTPRTGQTLQARFLIWGLYLGVQDMIENERFENVHLVLRWEGQIVGIASIQKRAGAPSLSATDSTSETREKSASYPLSTSASERLDGTSVSLSMPNTPSNSPFDVKWKPTSLGEPLPKRSFTLALLEGILAVASRTSRAGFESPVEVQPPAPYNAELQIVPQHTAHGRPYLTYGFVALALRQIPVDMLLEEHGWVELHFQIVADTSDARIVLAECSLLQG